MDFPRFVFTSPGPLACGFKQTYGQEIVTSQEDYDSALKAGFFSTIPEAIEANKVHGSVTTGLAVVQPVLDPPEVVSVASTELPASLEGKEKLVAKAISLGIKIKGNWGEKALTKAIEEAEDDLAAAKNSSEGEGHAEEGL